VLTVTNQAGERNRQAGQQQRMVTSMPALSRLLSTYRPYRALETIHHTRYTIYATSRPRSYVGPTRAREKAGAASAEATPRLVHYQVPSLLSYLIHIIYIRNIRFPKTCWTERAPFRQQKIEQCSCFIANATAAIRIPRHNFSLEWFPAAPRYIAIFILHTQKTHKKHYKNSLRLHHPKWSTPNDMDETK